MIYIEGAMIIHVESFLPLRGGDIFLEEVDPSIIDENVTAPVLLADHRTERVDTGLVGEG